MYCSICECEFNGWKGKCPNCKNPLSDGAPPLTRTMNTKLSYEKLVDSIRENGGILDIDVATIEVCKSKSTRFPWLGYGYAWAKRMQGFHEGIVVDLIVSKVGKDRKYAFPYQGHGYAWQEELEGNIAGKEVYLLAKKITRKRRWRFPYLGFGYAWTELMIGNCNENIVAKLNTTEVSNSRGWRFPYFGFGYAWVKNGILSLSLVQ